MIEQITEMLDRETTLAIITVAVALVEAARRFRETGNIPYRDLPWAAKREILLWFRRRFFTRDRPDDPTAIVRMSPGEVRTTLASIGYVPEWALSYRYGGEVLTMRFYYYDETKSLPHRQVHVRGFRDGAGTELMAHEEPTPDHHPKEHLSGDEMVYEGVNETVLEHLENASVGEFPRL